MKKFWQWVVVLGTLLLAIGGYRQVAHAESVGYTVNAVLPKNQDDSKATYFALRMKPNQEQNLTVVITNQTKSAQKFQVSVNQAITNNNGVIDYSQNKPTLDKSLKVGIKDVFDQEKPQTVTVAGKKSKKVTVRAKMPAQKINGMILGGINVTKLDNEDEKDSKGVMINNKFAYVIGVRLREASNNVGPNMNLLSVKAGQINSLNQVKAKLQNPEPGIMSNLKVKAKVTKAGEDKVLLENEKANMAMAPNSNFDYSLPWGDKEMKAGNYTLTLDATAKGGYHWHFVKNFTITKEEVGKLANKFNQPEKQKSYLWWFVAGGILIVLLLAVIIYLLLKNRRKNDDSPDASK